MRHPLLREAPGTRGLPLLGSIVELRRRGQIPFYIECWQRYGDLARFHLGPVVCHIVAHPDDVKHVLVTGRASYGKGLGYRLTEILLGKGLLTSEGALWQRQRRLLQPPFMVRSVERYAAAMVEAAERMLARWATASTEGRPVRVEEEMTRLAFSVIARAVLGGDLDREQAEVLRAYEIACQVVNDRLAIGIDVPLWVPTPAHLRFRAARRVLDGFFHRLITERRRAPRGDDILARLLVEADGEAARAMDDAQLCDELVTMLFAGHETTAMTLTWAFYALSQSPVVEERLHAELDGVLSGRAPALGDLERLPYLGRVIEEVMRLYPPVWTFPRAALADEQLSGFAIPKDSLIFPSPYLTHRHPAFWSEPERFDPDRFTEERARQRPACTYYPFGAGPRQCLGMHFGVQEMRLVLAAVASRYRLRLAPGDIVTPSSAITMHPRGGLRMFLERR